MYLAPFGCKTAKESFLISRKFYGQLLIWSRGSYDACIEKWMQIKLKEQKKKKQISFWHTEKCTLFLRFGLKDVFFFCGLMGKIESGVGFSVTMKRAEIGKFMHRILTHKIEIESKAIVCFVRKDILSFDNI